MPSIELNDKPQLFFLEQMKRKRISASKKVRACYNLLKRTKMTPIRCVNFKATFVISQALNRSTTSAKQLQALATFCNSELIMHEHFHR